MSPLGSVLFLHDIDRVMNAKFTARTVEELMNPAGIKIRFVKKLLLLKLCSIILIVDFLDHLFISVITVTVIFEMYQWLICYLISSTEERYKENIKLGKDPFTAKNDAQVFYARPLSLAFIEVGRKK